LWRRFKGIWRDSWAAIGIHPLQRRLGVVGMPEPNAARREPLLTHDNYQAKVIRQVKDPFIRAFLGGGNMKL